MNLGELIVSVLAPVGLPIEPGTFTEAYDTYIVYNYDELPTLFADNEPQFTRYLVQVHLIAPPGRYTYGFREDIKRNLILNDFTHPAVIGGSDITKTGGGEQHFIFECEYAIAEEAE